MKFKYTNLLILALLLVQCDIVGNLEEEPKNFVSEVNFYQTADDAQTALNGVYAALYQGSFYETAFWALITGREDYVNSRGSQAPISIYSQALDPTNQFRATISYSEIYNMINRANAVIERVPEIDMNEGTRSQIIAEALWLRSFGYSNLAKYWGGGPIKLIETKGLDNIAVPNASADEIWNQVEADLLAAIPNLPDQNGSGRITSWAGKMLLAEKHIANEEWQDALTLAEDVINNGPFSLIEIEEPDDFLEKIYSPDVYGHAEEIFAINYSSDNSNQFVIWIQRPAPFNVLGPSVGGGYWAKVPVMNSWLGEWDENDLRQQYNLYSSVVIDGEEVPLPDTSPVLFKKYQDHTSTGGSRNQAQIFRLPEAYLWVAEALNEMNGGPTAEAYEALNKVRRRAYGYDPDVVSPVDYAPGMSQQEFRNTVLLERAKEFMLEGKRWHDLLRTGTAAEAIEATGKTFNDVSLLFPFPEEEIQNNPAWSPEDQNPGY